MKKDKILIWLFIGLAVAVLALYIMKAKIDKAKGITKFPIGPGSSGKPIMMIQAFTDTPITGTWDAATDNAVNNYLNTDSYTASDFTLIYCNPADATTNFPISTGSTGYYVKWLQILLGVPPSGKFDSATQAAAKSSSVSFLDYQNLFKTTLGI